MNRQKHNTQNLSTKTVQHIPNNDNQFISLKEETLKWILSIVCSLLAYLVVAIIVFHVYHPDINSIIEAADKKFLYPGLANPKPMESLLFRLGIVTIIPGLPGFYIFFSKHKLPEKMVGRPIYLFLSILCILFLIALIYFDFTALNPFGPGSANGSQNGRDVVSLTNFDFYFQGIFMGKYFLLYLFLIVPLIACLFLVGFKKYQWEQTNIFKILSSVAGYIVVAWAIIAIILMNIYEFPYSPENQYDFNAVYYSMTQVYAGVPMLVEGFTNTYGLYPHFLNPLFQLTGLSVFNFSLVMSLLTGLSFLLNFYLLKQFVRNKIILFLGFITVIFFSYLDFKLLTHFDSLFSLFPIRYIIPSSLALLATIYFNKRSIKIYWTIFIIMALFVLWNPEIGIMSYLSWVVVNIYTDFYNHEGKLDIKRISFHLFVAIITIFFVFSLYELTIYAFYGSWPDLLLLFGPILFFGKFGFANLPMSIIHPWNISALVLLLGFLYSLKKLCRKDITVSSSMILLISLLGLGYFFYFEGRSQNSNFALSSSFSLILLTILGDKLWQVVQKSNVVFLNLLFVVFLFIVSFSFVEIIYNTNQLVALIYQTENKKKYLNTQKQLLAYKTYISNNTKPGQKIILLAAKANQALLFDGDKRVSGVNPGFTDMFLFTDLVRMEHTLRDSAYNVFMKPEEIYPYLSRSVAAVAATYELASKTGSVYMGYKRKRAIPSQIFFRNIDSLLIHRKYNDDTLSIATRINDALGVHIDTIYPEFSVQVLFYSAPQAFDYATIVSDVVGATGFVIGNVANTSNYFFGVNGISVTFRIPYAHWSYCVMNVYPDHYIVYTNGVRQFSHPLSSMVKKLNNDLFIGNMVGGLHYYIGAISEVAVSNRTIDTTQIQSTWEEIKQVTMK